MTYSKRSSDPWRSEIEETNFPSWGGFDRDRGHKKPCVYYYSPTLPTIYGHFVSAGEFLDTVPGVSLYSTITCITLMASCRCYLPIQRVYILLFPKHFREILFTGSFRQNAARQEGVEGGGKGGKGGRGERERERERGREKKTLRNCSQIGKSLIPRLASFYLSLLLMSPFPPNGT